MPMRQSSPGAGAAAAAAKRANPTLLANLQRDYTILEDSHCRCGSSKAVGDSFCGKCLRALPAAHQKAMRVARPGAGFAEAYRAASISLGEQSQRARSTR